MEIPYPPLKTILVAHDTPESPPEIVACLTECKYHVITRPNKRNEVSEAIQTLKPQLVLMTIRHDAADKFASIRQVLHLRSAGVIILMKEWNAQLAKQAMEYGIAGYLIEPYEKTQVRAALESSWHHYQKLASLQDDLETRKLLQKAKGILMKEQFITEEEAHQTILRMSQDQSIPLKEVCQALLQIKSHQQQRKPSK